MKRTEFYTTPDGVVMAKPDGEPVRVLTERDRELVGEVLAAMGRIWPEALRATAALYERSAANRPYYEWLVATRFIRCNMGEYDTLTPDADDGGDWHLEEVRCPMRGECRHEGVICKPRRDTSLSSREIEVARLVGHMTADEIADTLCISPCTVRNHIAAIKAKLGMRRTAEIAAWTERHGGV